MSESRADLILEMLGATHAEQAEIRSDPGGIRERPGILEARYASLWRRADRLGGDPEQVKRRLGLIEA